MQAAGVGRVQTFIKPSGNGTELIIEYMVQLSQLTPAATEFLVNMSQFPKTVEQILTEAKTRTEKPGKI